MGKRELGMTNVMVTEDQASKNLPISLIYTPNPATHFEPIESLNFVAFPS